MVCFGGVRTGVGASSDKTATWLPWDRNHLDKILESRGAIAISLPLVFEGQTHGDPFGEDKSATHT